MRIRAWVAVLAVGAAGLVVACSGDEGGSSTATATSSSAAASSGGDTGGGSGQGGSAPAACDAQGLACEGAQGCQACAREGACKPDLDACTANAECLALNNCFGMCESKPAAEQDACRTQCRTDHPSGATTYDAIALCVICDQCKTSCAALSADCPP